MATTSDPKPLKEQIAAKKRDLAAAELDIAAQNGSLQVAQDTLNKATKGRDKLKDEIATLERLDTGSDATQSAINDQRTAATREQEDANRVIAKLHTDHPPGRVQKIIEKVDAPILALRARVLALTGGDDKDLNKDELEKAAHDLESLQKQVDAVLKSHDEDTDANKAVLGQALLALKSAQTHLEAATNRGEINIAEQILKEAQTALDGVQKKVTDLPASLQQLPKDIQALTSQVVILKVEVKKADINQQYDEANFQAEALTKKLDDLNKKMKPEENEDKVSANLRKLPAELQAAQQSVTDATNERDKRKDELRDKQAELTRLESARDANIRGKFLPEEADAATASGASGGTTTAGTASGASADVTSSTTPIPTPTTSESSPVDRTSSGASSDPL